MTLSPSCCVVKRSNVQPCTTEVRLDRWSNSSQALSGHMALSYELGGQDGRSHIHMSILISVPDLAQSERSVCF